MKDGAVVGRAATAPGGSARRAEPLAIAMAGEAARGATLYVTLEPCSHTGSSPPCADAVIKAGIARVVSALEDPNPRVAGQGHARLRAAGIRVDVGPGADQARRDHRGHILRVTEGRPCVTLKLAETADGFASGGRHDPRLHITGQIANLRVQIMRATHEAILVGVETALADDPALTVRLPGLERKPWRVVLDTHLRLPPQSRLATGARTCRPSSSRGRTRLARRPRALPTSASSSSASGSTPRAMSTSVRRCARSPRAASPAFSAKEARASPRNLASGLADTVALFTAERPLAARGSRRSATKRARRSMIPNAIVSQRPPYTAPTPCGSGSGGDVATAGILMLDGDSTW